MYKIIESMDTIKLPGRQNKLKEYEILWLQRLDDLIQVHLGDNQLTSFSIASEMFVSRVQLFRKIKKLTGLTPMKYLKSARYNKAIKLIIQCPFKRIKDIAHKVGYKDEKYFARQFKSYYGKSPSTFVKERLC